MPVLSVIIPVYNEERFLESIVRHVADVRLPDGVEKEIILVDDASTDKTPDTIHGLCRTYPQIQSFRLPHNSGKGAAVRFGMTKMNGDYAVVQDADLEYDPNDWNALLPPLLDGQVDAVFGSRFLKSGKNVSFRHHRSANRFLTAVFNLLAGSRLTDIETCYKMLRCDVWRDLSLESNRFGIEPEIAMKLIRHGYRITEVPVSFQGRSFDEGKKITWRDGIEALRMMLRYRFTGVKKKRESLLET